MEEIIINFGSGTTELTDDNEAIIKHFLYSNFGPEKELEITYKNRSEKILLKDLFNKLIK